MFQLFKQNGLSMIGVLVVIAFLIAAITYTIPAYRTYQRGVQYALITKSINSYISAVDNCYQEQGTLSGCNAGTNNIPANITTRVGIIDKLSVENGVIEITPTEQYGLTHEDTLLLTPIIENNRVTWKKSGHAYDKGYID